MTVFVGAESFGNSKQGRQGKWCPYAESLHTSGTKSPPDLFLFSFSEIFSIVRLL